MRGVTILIRCLEFEDNCLNRSENQLLHVIFQKCLAPFLGIWEKSKAFDLTVVDFEGDLEHCEPVMIVGELELVDEFAP